MSLRSALALVASSLVLGAGGCAVGPDDPLLVDGSGAPRASVPLAEIEEAGLDEPCSSALEGLSATSLVRVPVEGTAGRAFLVAAFGLALCLEEGEGGREGALPFFPPAVPPGQDGDGEGEDDATPAGQLGSTFVPAMAHPPAASQPRAASAQDPTPQPIKS